MTGSGRRLASRSYEKVTVEDVARLARTAEADLERFFARNPKWTRQDVVAIGFAQGGAEHYVRGERGIYDLDTVVWFTGDPRRQTRRPVVLWDWGESKFGRCPNKGPEYIGRPADVKYWTIGTGVTGNPVAAVRQWLQKRAVACGDSARYFAQHERLDVAHEPVVLLSPGDHYLDVIWDPGPPPPPPDKTDRHRRPVGMASD